VSDAILLTINGFEEPNVPLHITEDPALICVATVVPLGFGDDGIFGGVVCGFRVFDGSDLPPDIFASFLVREPPSLRRFDNNPASQILGILI